jgi:hypothetical protein
VAGDGAVPIKGLKELRRGLKHYNGNINKTVKKAHTRVANLVIKEAPKAAGRRGPSRGPAGSTRGAQRLAQSFRPVQSAKSAKIRSPLPDAYGQEYGSRRFLRFPAYRGFDNGAVGERAVSDNREEIGEEYLEAIFDALKEAYPDG